MCRIRSTAATLNAGPRTVCGRDEQGADGESHFVSLHQPLRVHGTFMERVPVHIPAGRQGREVQLPRSVAQNRRTPAIASANQGPETLQIKDLQRFDPALRAGGCGQGATGSPLSSKLSTCKAVKAGFWPWRPG